MCSHQQRNRSQLHCRQYNEILAFVSIRFGRWHGIAHATSIAFTITDAMTSIQYSKNYTMTMPPQGDTTTRMLHTAGNDAETSSNRMHFLLFLPQTRKICYQFRRQPNTTWHSHTWRIIKIIRRKLKEKDGEEPAFEVRERTKNAFANVEMEKWKE